MTGEPRLYVSWRDKQGYWVANKEEVPLSGVSVLVENGGASAYHERVHVNVAAGDDWSIPRLPLDRRGVLLYRVPAGDVIAQVSVSEDGGRKVLTLQSSVLVKNEFGCLLHLKMVDGSYETDIGLGESVPIPIAAIEGGQFRLRPDLPDSSWSGSVSIADIKARNESKLWQINSGGRFLYVSGQRKTLTYQDRVCVQLEISVFAPLRIKSTIPAMVDYQVATPTPIGGQRFSHSGSLSLNGREYVSTVPLTGRLELKLSFLDNRCVSMESVQVWPVRTGELMQEETTKQYYLPIRFVDSTNPASTCVFKLYYESLGVKPPELTIHTGQWLVCIDVPTQLRFATDDADWTASSPNYIATPRGEKTFATPLDVSAKRIAAYLNSTRSERISVDAIGSTGSITLDAYDESAKTRVKQDLAVRVSSVGAGMVRDSPVKITTVSPRYILVNTLLEKGPIFVRQVGTPGNGIPVGSGDQVPFRWWVADSEGAVDRLIQVRTGSVWSDGIKVNEIGEIVIGKVANLRAEVRIYRGGFYIVFSTTNGDTTSAVSPATTAPPVTNSVYQLLLPSLAVSLTGPVASRNSERSEILVLDIKTFIANLSLSSVANEVDVRMASVQIDDFREESKFPVVFKKATVPRSSKSTGAEGALEVFAAWLPPSGSDSVLNFESFLIRFADFDLCVDYSLISDLTDMFVKCSRIGGTSSVYPYRYIPTLDVVPVGSLRIWAFKELLLHPMRVNLSFHPGSASSSNFSVFHRAISSMAAVERSPLKFRHLLLRRFRASRSNVVSVVTEHYKHELYREMRTIMGSADAFGNPIGLIGSLSTGVSDLFNEPLSAIREMQGPEDVINVADKTAKGAKSFFKNTTFGVFNSFSKLAATSAQTLSILTEDDEFVNERSDFNNRNKPSHLADGMVVGAASFGRGIISGLSGLVTKPVEGLEQDGLAGLAKGTMKGVGGLFLKPVAGLFDFAKSTADGVVSSTKDSRLDVNQTRLPRMLYSHDRSIRVVNPEHSLLKWYLGQLDSIPSNFTYCAHVYDVQNGLLIAASSTHLVTADTQARKISLLVPLWKIIGVSCDLDRLILSIQVASADNSSISLELSSSFIVKSVQQLIANAMEV